MARTAYWDERREKFAQALATGFKAVEAGKLVGYSAANSRRNARRSDVKARVAELQKPALDKVAEQIDLSVEWALTRLYDIASPNLGIEAIKTPDQLRAIELLAKIKGWMAPDKHDLMVRSADRMTDDELARIATGSSESTIGAPARKIRSELNITSPPARGMRIRTLVASLVPPKTRSMFIPASPTRAHQ